MNIYFKLGLKTKRTKKTTYFVSKKGDVILIDVN